MKNAIRIVKSSGRGKFWKELLLVTDVSTAWAEIVFRVKRTAFVSRGVLIPVHALKLIGLFSFDGIGCRTLNVCQQSLVGSSTYVSFDPSIVSQIR